MTMYRVWITVEKEIPSRIGMDPTIRTVRWFGPLEEPTSDQDYALARAEAHAIDIMGEGNYTESEGK